MGFPAPNTMAPDFETQNDAGATVRLSDYRGKFVVLYFYPKSDTPGCTKQACAFRDNYGAFQKRDVAVLGASHDTVAEQAAFKQKFALPFILLADPDHSIGDLYGVWGDHEIPFQGKIHKSTGIRRSTLIISPDGMVLDSRWGVDPTTDSEQVLALLDGFGVRG